MAGKTEGCSELSCDLLSRPEQGTERLRDGEQKSQATQRQWGGSGVEGLRGQPEREAGAPPDQAGSDNRHLYHNLYSGKASGFNMR